MEALAPEILEMVVELAVNEVMHCILATKCCVWSRKKWKKVMDQVHHQREDRSDRIRRRVSQVDEKQDIKDYAVRLTKI